MMAAYEATDRGKESVLRKVKKYQNSEHGKRVLARYTSSEDYKDSMYRRSKAYYLRNPEKKSAHDKVYYALKTGKLFRCPCEVCGSNEVQAHHDDYSKPLDVRWLCAEHHVQEHYRSA